MKMYEGGISRKINNFIERMTQNVKTRRVFHRLIVYFLLIAGGTLLMIPLFWLLSSSLKDQASIFASPPEWIPRPVQWSNYLVALKKMDFLLSLKNTMIITLFSVIGQVLSASFIGYGFARLRFRGRNALFILLLSTMMLPAQVTMVPVFILFKTLGWVDTFKPLIVPAFFGTAFYIFLFRQFFLSIPTELEDAARIDGCSRFGVYWRIMLPLSKPALITVGIFSFMISWNDFLRPLIYINSQSKFTLALSLNMFKTLYGTQDVHLVMAASMVIMLPCLIIFFMAQKYFVRSVILSGLKG